MCVYARERKREREREGKIKVRGARVDLTDRNNKKLTQILSSWQ